MKGCGVAVPTKEEFDAWLTLASTPIEVSASLPAEPAELTLDDAANYLRQADADRSQRWRVMNDMPARRWLVGQREYKRAVDRVFASRRAMKRSAAEPEIDYFRVLAKVHFDSAERSRARRVSEGWTASAAEKDMAHSLRRSIESAGSRAFEYSWATNTMRALAEYLEGQAAARILNAAAEIEGAANAAQKAVARYMRLSEVINGAGFLGFRAQGPRARFGFHFGAPDVAALPIGSRKDMRSDERLFVYRMFVANRSAVRSQKAEAIAELMGLEGFRHQYDSRNIERLCAKFAALHKRPSPFQLAEARLGASPR